MSHAGVEVAPRWPVFLPIAIAVLTLAAVLQWTAYAWIARVLQHAEQAMAGPWA